MGFSTRYRWGLATGSLVLVSHDPDKVQTHLVMISWKCLSLLGHMDSLHLHSATRKATFRSLANHNILSFVTSPGLGIHHSHSSPWFTDMVANPSCGMCRNTFFVASTVNISSGDPCPHIGTPTYNLLQGRSIAVSTPDIAPKGGFTIPLQSSNLSAGILPKTSCKQKVSRLHSLGVKCALAFYIKD